MKVACIPHHGWHFVLDVFKHQVVLGLFHGQSGVHVADDQIVTQRVLLGLDATVAVGSCSRS